MAGIISSICCSKSSQLRKNPYQLFELAGYRLMSSTILKDFVENRRNSEGLNIIDCLLMEHTTLSDSLPVRRSDRADSLCAWEDDRRSSSSPLKFYRDRLNTELSTQHHPSFVYPVTGRANISNEISREKSFVLRVHQSPRKPSAPKQQNSKKPKHQKRASQESKQLKIKPDTQNVSTMESEITLLECKPMLPRTKRQRSLPVSKRALDFEITDSRKDARIILADVDKYLSDYKIRGRMNQMFFENYHMGPSERARNHALKDGKCSTELHPTFSRRDWRNRRNMQFYMI